MGLDQVRICRLRLVLSVKPGARDVLLAQVVLCWYV